MASSKEQQLWDACTSGDLDLVRRLVNDEDVDVNWADPEIQRTTFYRACGHGRVAVVEFLLKDPRIDVNKTQKEEATPFFIACQQGHPDVVSLLLADERTKVNQPDIDGVTPFSFACQRGHKEVVVLLLNDPRIDANTFAKNGCTPFFIACHHGQKEVVSLLLADSRIDVNKPRDTQASPFFMACQEDHKEVVSLLLNDPRIKINELNHTGTTPLWMASQNGHLGTVQLVLTSEREVDTKTKTIAGSARWNNKTAAEIARLQGTRITFQNESEEEYTRKKRCCPLIASLIDSFDLDPATTRQYLRELPELRDPFIGDLFALVIFICDGLLVVGAESSASSSFSTNTSKKAARFFQIVQLLPMELQMVLCNRAFGAGKNLVLTKHSEPAFKKLGRLLAMSEV